ncbi:MAG: lipoyl(octanoyl) transferase LipB [Deltaproteobacteria bacterium]|nr:MAG: lipoyl(octanoyl) transferase LipB [Deltaproteobacteria bacterium]
MSRFVHLSGQVPYADGLALQEALLTARIRDEIDDTVLLLEHASTITVGRTRGAEANVLDAGDVPVVPVSRGGDVTWHGPGQLVAYPIVKLEGTRADLHLHLRSLEQAVIDLLADHGLDGMRDPRNTGVWLPIDGLELPRKTCSVGIACRKWTTWHGLALNVDADLGAFARIHPCGFEASVMTRMADHLDPCPSVDALVPGLAGHLATALDIPLAPVETADVTALLAELQQPSP